MSDSGSDSILTALMEQTGGLVAHGLSDGMDPNKGTDWILDKIRRQEPRYDQRGGH